jgi:iron(III) transport system substrate-binding protein
MRTTIRHACFAIASVALGFAYAGTLHAQSLAEIAMMKGTDRQAKLEAGARKEGAFSLYTTLVPEGSNPLQEAWEKKYPWVKTSFTRTASAAQIQRILAESRTGKANADVVMGSGSDALEEVKLLQPFSSPEMEAYPKEYVGKDNLYFTYRLASFGIGYNTRFVTGNDIPKSWEDLLNPKFKGHMIWSPSRDTGGPFLINHLRTIWGEKKADEYFDKLAKQDVVKSTASVRALLDLVIAGEHWILITTSLNHAVDSADKGAPVWFASPDPVHTRADHVMLPNNAPHPHAAMLFIDFLLSKAGQTVLQENEFQVSRPDVEPTKIQRPMIPRFNGRSEKVYSSQDLNGKEAVLDAIVNKVSP